MRCSRCQLRLGLGLGLGLGDGLGLGILNNWISTLLVIGHWSYRRAQHNDFCPPILMMKELQDFLAMANLLQPKLLHNPHGWEQCCQFARIVVNSMKFWKIKKL